MATATRTRLKDPVTQYAKAVAGGRIAAGPLVRLACERHLKDLKEGPARGLFFDVEAVERVIKFFGYLCLAEGEFAGQPFTLQPWQQFVIGSLFGWKGPDGFRRFRNAYIECGKGNGKSPLLAGIGLYGMVADDEPGAEIYSAAVNRDQAGILFADAKKMVAASPALSDLIENMANILTLKRGTSSFRPVSSEGKSLDGKRVHMALIDEVHEHPSAMVIDKMRAGTKGRRQPMILEITNSGYDRHSVCWQHHEYSEKVVSGLIENDSWFAYVCGLDEGDDWTDDKVWLKANPNLGVSVPVRYLREQVEEAIGMPGKQNIVQRLNLCIWTEQAERWLDMQVYDKCVQITDTELLKGKRCFAGLDLASTTDVAALALVFPDGEGAFDVLMKYWVPAETVIKRSQRDGIPYDVWVREGWIEATEGNVIDYDVIRERIKELAEVHDVREVGYDRWGATQLMTQLKADGATVVPIGQGFASLSAPAKELEKLILGGKIRFQADPVLRWMFGNAALEQDAAGNIKPSKSRSRDKVDGVFALIMALDRAIRHQGDDGSVYDSRGLLVL